MPKRNFAREIDDINLNLKNLYELLTVDLLKGANLHALETIASLSGEREALRIMDQASPDRQVEAAKAYLVDRIRQAGNLHGLAAVANLSEIKVYSSLLT